ncbi:reverse transcriptase-like protein, partial [Mycobacterium kansasii]
KTWQMFFDGAARATGAGAGVIFITPQGDLLSYSFTLGAACTNNEAEYNALIIGMEIASELKIKDLHIYGDSKLVINQVATEFETRKPEL